MYFVVGDIHGCYEEMKEILKYWNKDNQTLILLGDLIDRGLNSLKCLKLAMELNIQENVVVLGGNHEETFLEWLSMEGQEGFYYMSIFDNTIRSFFPKQPDILQKYTKTKIADKIRRLYPDVLHFMRNRPMYYETEHLLFVHAGCDLSPSWKETAEKYCKYIRWPFIYGENKTGKKIIFGHTPTREIYNDSSNDNIWISPCGTKIGIDGGCVYGGQLNAIVIDENGKLINTYSVRKINN
jgi:serine/threonine protein phosphatase 1